jgi:hypothetical protein
MNVAEVVWSRQQGRNAGSSLREVRGSVFQAENETERSLGRIGAVQLYAASASTAKSCTQTRFTSEAFPRSCFLAHPAKAALGATE